jgi:hypothetical protein
MTERFSQFSGLVDNCEFEQGEKETTCMDLKGFWEMIYFQVLILLVRVWMYRYTQFITINYNQ